MLAIVFGKSPPPLNDRFLQPVTIGLRWKRGCSLRLSFGIAQTVAELLPGTLTPHTRTDRHFKG